MNCDFCDKPAVVHEMTVKNGIKKEVHLCHEHAIDAGIDLPEHQPISKLLAQVTVSHAKSRSRSEHRRCPECGFSFAEFRKSGTLGCPECFNTLEKPLTKLIERAQNGATHHTGKTPKRAGVSLDRQLLIQKLVKDLDCAVSAEQYERAATIRDQIHTLEIITPPDDRN